jgi:predicted transcriptional regulator
VTTDELEGNTLSIYAYIVRADGPVGLREITRGVELSSSSVTHHHLQKLDSLGLIEKNSYGQYSLKAKAPIDGYMWVGRNLVPRLVFYSFFFMGISIVAISFILSNLVFKSLVNTLKLSSRFTKPYFLYTKSERYLYLKNRLRKNKKGWLVWLFLFLFGYQYTCCYYCYYCYNSYSYD